MTKDRIRLGAVLAVAVALALVVWILLSDGDDSAQPDGTTTAAPLLDERELATRARSLETSPYWVGPRDGSAYELTTTPAGRAFVRYLPEGVDAGDPRPDFLTIATYPLGTNARAVLRRAGRERGAQTVELPGGALVATDAANPTSAFLARKGWTFQVEVYHPEPGEAMRLVLAGAVREIR